MDYQNHPFPIDHIILSYYGTIVTLCDQHDISLDPLHVQRAITRFFLRLERMQAFIKAQGGTGTKDLWLWAVSGMYRLGCEVFFKPLFEIVSRSAAQKGITLPSDPLINIACTWNPNKIIPVNMSRLAVPAA